MAIINASTSAGLVNTGDTDGTIKLQSNGVTIATVSSTGLSTQVGSPAFSAYSGPATTVSNGVFTKISFNTEEFDLNSNYDTSTSRFTPTIAGYYQINATDGFVGQTTNGAFLAIYKNGAVFKSGNLYSASSAGIISTITALVYLNGSTDYVEIYAYQNSGSNKNTVSASATDSYFQASMVRSA